jgi:PAS domain S-box-containing protein
MLPAAAACHDCGHGARPRIEPRQAARRHARPTRRHNADSAVNAALPADEAQRLQALRDSAILDSEPEASFDSLTRLAAQICGTPIALVSLVDESRQWFKARVGLAVPETPRDVAFCAHAILRKEEVFEVTDACLDPRFASNPLVRADPNIRFYAGAPLITDGGHALGTLCVIDRAPRTLSESQRQALRLLAAHVTELIESRRRLIANLRYEAALAQAKDELAAAAAWQRAIVDSTVLSIVATDRQGVIRSFNRASERLFGRRAADVVGKAAATVLFDPSEIEGRAADSTREFGRTVEPGAEVLWAKVRPASPQAGQWTCVRGDGSRLQARLTVTALVDTAGQLSGFMGVFADLTEHQREEARFRAAVEHAPYGVIMLNPAGQIELVNLQTERLFGYSREELAGRAIEVLVPERFRAAHPAQRQAFYAEPRARAMGSGRDLYGRRKDGSEFPIEIGLSPIETVDGTKVLSAIVDITERKRTDAALRESNAMLERQAAELAEAKDRAEAADRLKSAFLATMSHELRTPLNSIIGFTGIMLQGLAGPLNDEQRVQLGKVRDSGRHLLALINDVLDVSKIESGQLEVGRDPFDLRASIEKAAASMQPLADAKGLALRVEMDAAVGQGRGDVRRAEQVLLNLLSNAIKFTEQGSVTLRAAVVDDAALRVDVIDTGIGIAAQDMGKLFQAFRQIDSRLARQHEGTGLGLVVSRKLAELMGGRLEVKSTPQVGSVFSLTLPAVQEADS